MDLQLVWPRLCGCSATFGRKDWTSYAIVRDLETYNSRVKLQGKLSANPKCAAVLRHVYTNGAQQHNRDDRAAFHAMQVSMRLEWVAELTEFLCMMRRRNLE